MNKQGYIQKVREDLKKEVKYNKTSIEKLASSFGITNKNLVKEYTELAIVLNAREIARNNRLTTYEKYLGIVALYENQVNLSMRTSMSMLMQQYSTPAPISFLASSYIMSDDPNAQYLEPSAGNGLLTIALPYEETYVNELDDVRLENLKEQPFAKVMNWDALHPPMAYNRLFDGVITNPPFGSLSEPMLFGKFKIKGLEHAMSLKALQCMKDNGKSAIIIGGHTDWDEQGRVKAGKNRIFLNYLYHFYNVEDVIPINGKKLYSRQGTSFDTRLILINGAKEHPEGASPLKNKLLSTVVNTHEELWERVGLKSSKLKAESSKENKEWFENYGILLNKKEDQAFEKYIEENNVTMNLKPMEVRQKIVENWLKDYRNKSKEPKQPKRKTKGLKVYYGFRKLTAKAIRKPQLAVFFENVNHNVIKNEEWIKKRIKVSYVRNQTPEEEVDGNYKNRLFTEYASFINDKPYYGDIEKVLEENYKADDKHVSKEEREIIRDILREDYYRFYDVKKPSKRQQQQMLELEAEAIIIMQMQS